MAWSLVCPASRGIGFHLTRHLLQNTTIPIVATARRDMAGVKRNILKNMKDVDSNRLTVLELDVTDESTVSRAALEAKSLFPPSRHHLHLAFSIPGILYPEKSPSQLDHANISSTFATNTIGPLLLMKHFSQFLPRKTTHFAADANLPRQAIWLAMSARVGSTSDNHLGGWYSYRASKAAINSITKTFDLFLQARCGDNAMAISFHPGTVKTALSQPFWGNVLDEKLFTPDFAIDCMWTVVSSLGLVGRGRCWDWQGKEIPP